MLPEYRPFANRRPNAFRLPRTTTKRRRDMLSIPRIRLVIPAVLAAVAALALAAPAVASAANFSLTINIEPSEEAGTVECEVNEGGIEPCEPEYEEGDAVNLVPEAEEGYEFVGFTGDCGFLVCELEMDSDKEVTAIFEGELGVYHSLELEVEGSGFGEIECDAGFGFEECDLEYEAGTELTLLPVPGPESEFEEWGGDCTGEGEECELTMDEEHSVSAVFAAVTPEYELEIAFGGSGEGEVECEAQEGPEPCESGDLFPAGTELTLIPVAIGESEFEEWGGDCEGQPELCEIEMNEDHFVEPVFKSTGSPEEFELEVSVTGEGEVNANEPPNPVAGAIAGCEEGGAGECEATYVEGDEVTLVATPEAGWETTGWTGCTELGANECKVTMNANKAVEVEFEEEPPGTHSLALNHTGEGTLGAECEEGSGYEACASPLSELPDGTEVKVTASPETGWKLESISGTGSASACSASPCTFTITANSTVTATFAEVVPPPTPEYTLTIDKNGTGSGSVSCNGGACAAKYTEGTSVTLAASPASGSTFAGWSGGGCSGTGGCVVTINSDTTVTATFNAESSPPPPPVEEGTARVANKATVKSGKALLKVKCSGGSCKGKLKLVAKVKKGKRKKNLTIGKASFSLASGATKTIRVKLSGPAKAELAKGRTVKAKVKGSGVVHSTVKLKNAKKKKKK
jgi:hypothetical protein